MPRFRSPSNSFFHASTLDGEHVWINPPFNLIHQALEHYLALKAKTPNTTSACILVPRWPGASWNRLLQGMQVIQSFEVGYPLFHMERTASQNTATPMIPWPVDIYLDTAYVAHSVRLSHNRAQGAPVPAMHFEAVVCGTPATVALDSQATHCFIDKQYARATGLKCTPTHRMVQLADGSHTQVASECQIYLKICSLTQQRTYKSKVPCLVIDLGDDHNVILGQDWLLKEKAEMSFATNTCTLGEREGLKLTPPSHTTPHRVIKPTLSWARALKAVAEGCELLTVKVQAMPGLPPPPPEPTAEPLAIPESVSPQVRKILLDHAQVFGRREGLPPDRGTTLTIPEMPGATPQFKHPYRLSPAEVQEVEKQIKELLKQGLIEPSNSPYGAPIIFVKKKDGTLRMCCDWRRLNAQTVKSRYPLPRIDELLDALQGAQIFSSLDLQSGYHQILIHPEDAPKTAFTTPFGHYQWRVMSFGLCNAPAIFQQTMNKILAPLLRKGVLVYMDDILIYAKTREEHAQILGHVLDLLHQSNLYVKLSKCDFEKSELKFLGHIVGREGIKVDPAKTQVVADWPTPTCIKDVRSFLGLANYFRKFVQGYSTLVEPLTNLTRKELVWNNQTWSPACEQAFQGVKTALTHAPVLAMPDPAEGSYEVICDASLVGTGAVLTQAGKPIAYESTKFSDVEYRWTTTEQELWAVVHALKTWRCYLEGVPFKVVTDHNPLVHLHTQSNLTRKQARWSQYLQQFDFTWEYRPGRTNVADPLSRIPQVKPAVLNAITLKTLTERRTRSQTGALTTPTAPEAATRGTKRKRSQSADRLPREMPAQEAPPPPAAQSDLLAKVQEGYGSDPWFAEPSNISSARLHQVNGLWHTDNNQVAVPDVPNLRQEILFELHDAPYSGHPGVAKTKQAVKNLYWWPKMAKEIQEYVHTCASCQRNKPLNEKPAGVLHPLPIPTDKWESVSMDFITQLPKASGPIPYDAIVVFVDRLTKMVRIAPTTSDVSAKGTAQLLFDHVFRHHGVPKSLITDRGSVFTSQVFKEFTTLVGTQHKLSTAYHPQSDGQTERTNQTLETMLRHYVGGREHGEWHTCLAAAEFAINTAYTPSIGTTPFRLNYGRDPRLPASIASDRVPQEHEWADRMLYGLADAKRCLKAAQDRQKALYDKGRRDVQYAVGDLVLLRSKYIALRRMGDNASSPKLLPLWIGPYPVEKVVGKGAYQLTLPPHMLAHNVFNVVNLKPFRPSERSQPPAPLLVDGETEFVIDSIISHRPKGRTTQYRVRWAGYGPECNTWEPQKNLIETEAFEKYWHALGLEPPVQATSKQAVKARAAKLVHAQQEDWFPYELAFPDLPCWKPIARRTGPLD